MSRTIGSSCLDPALDLLSNSPANLPNLQCTIDAIKDCECDELFGLLVFFDVPLVVVVVGWEAASVTGGWGDVGIEVGALPLRVRDVEAGVFFPLICSTYIN